MGLASDRPYTLILTRADTLSTEVALQSALAEAQGLRPAVGLTITSDQAAIDPHERTRRYFRLRPLADRTLVVEHGSDESADYFLASSLAAAGIREVDYAALSPGFSGGVLARFFASRNPLELWLEDGVADPELSTMTPGDGSPADILASWGAPEQSPRFDAGYETVLAFAGEL